MELEFIGVALLREVFVSQGKGDRVVSLFDELKFCRLTGAMFRNLIKGSVDAGARIPAVAYNRKEYGRTIFHTWGFLCQIYSVS